MTTLFAFPLPLIFTFLLFVAFAPVVVVLVLSRRRWTRCRLGCWSFDFGLRLWLGRGLIGLELRLSLVRRLSDPGRRRACWRLLCVERYSERRVLPRLLW